MTEPSDVIVPGRTGAGMARGAMLLLICVCGCGFGAPAWALHWPWTHRPTAPQSAAVRVLSVSLDGAAGTGGGSASARTILQYWDRNALLLDLTHLGGSGGATLTPVPANGGWPVRLEFRVPAGTMARLEVLADQRVVFTVPAQGGTGGAVLLRLDPGVYQPDTARISLRWSAVDALPH